MPRFIYFECSSVVIVMTINYQTQSILLQVNSASDLGEPRGRRGLRSNRMSMFHHQPSHRFGGCCRGRHCHCVAVLLYFPALPSRNRFLFWEQNRAVESTSSARSCKKLAGISEKPVVAHQKQNEPTNGRSAFRRNG